MQSGNLVIKYSMLLDSTLVASRLTWNKGGEETTKISYYNKEGQDVLEDFTGDSFIMETLYAPQENVLIKSGRNLLNIRSSLSGRPDCILRMRRCVKSN